MSHTGFRSVPTLVTLSDLEQSYGLIISQNTAAFGSDCIKFTAAPILRQQESSRLSL